MSCLENNGYETPELNEKIYLHFRGFRKIENLDKFVSCKALWLDSNGFSQIENLEPLVELRCLYISKNLISKMEGLDTLQHLTILDLSNNRLAKIENLSCCSNLQTINVSHNVLSSVDSIAHFKECPALNNIDMTNNRLEADEAFFETLSGIPALVALSVNGNEITKLASFRKKMIANLPKLGYLDRPIDVQERTFAEAFVNGGPEAEAAARAQWKLDVEKKRIDDLAIYKAWQAEQQILRETARAEGRSLITEVYTTKLFSSFDLHNFAIFSVLFANARTLFFHKTSPAVQFTAEERAQRQAEAEAASAAERRMLDIGIGKVASRYWQLEARNAQGGSGFSGGGVDALELAAAQLAAEADQAESQSENQDEVAGENYATTPAAEALTMESAVTNTNSESSETLAMEIEEVTVRIEETVLSTGEVAIDQQNLEENQQEGGADETKSASEVSDEAAADAAKILGMSEMEMQHIRDERVAESFYIYKKQLEAQKAGRSAIPPPSKPSTWDTPAPAAADLQQDRPLYWSESMDMQLAKLVKACVFDFDAISTTMQQLAAKNALASAAVHAKPALLTNEACRLRWAQLDAEQWSSVAPNSSALDTEFKVCISSAVLGAGHGSQPSYEALASMAAGSVPAYLKVPTTFPSVQDQQGDADSDLDLD